MGRIRPFLTPLAQQDLIEYLACNGENYERYCAYADMRGWKKYTKTFLHTWIGRHRNAIQLARAVHLTNVKKALVMDKAARLKDLECNAQLLTQKIQAGAATLQTDELVKLIEQHRKVSQAIATERGEWGHKDDGSQDLEDLHALLQRRMQKALGDGNTVDAEFTVLE